MEVKVEFERKILNVDNYPFELLINTDLINDPTKINFNWCWYVELQKFDDDENDHLNLQRLMVEIIQKIIKITDIKITGITLYKNLYEIIFYAKEEDTQKIGGEFAEMPYELEDRENRFIKYHAKRDNDWNNVKLYFDAFTKN
ncbi:hypothetical protein [Chryseobacterium taiwanense]|uniref:DUF695 domain-containing protein n=1 Tax=Chryseobacterium taiwanense TaxID=363331 RepID=A0A0B4DFV0_9FLAO|nr:hypothetical protein [Chryseobacterium taiwanense]KIC63230.1 hypothetical protein RM51_09285 [Chryseobacterium taiwanense]